MSGPASQYDKPKNKYLAKEDTSFVSGDSPVVYDVRTTLNRNGIDGYIKCDGNGDIIINISADGDNYGDNIRLKIDDTFNLRALSIHKIKITHVSNSSYRVFVV